MEEMNNSTNPEMRSNLQVENMELENNISKKRNRETIEDQQEDSSKIAKTDATPTENGKKEDQNPFVTPKSVPDFFDPGNKGPYGVWVKKAKFDSDGLSAYKVGSILFEKYDVVDIKRKGRYRVEVLFKHREEANRFLADGTMRKDHDLVAFFPGHRKMRRGIVKGIPVDFTEDDIVRGYEGNFEIEAVKRMKKKVKNAETNEKEWVDCQTVLITFAGQDLPSEIVIYKVKSKVEPYVPRPMQCFKCFRYGHTSKTCRGKDMCIMCGKEKHQDKCSVKSPNCYHCSGQHKSTDFNCPIYKKYEQINTIMSFENLSFIEAKEKIFPKTTNRPFLTKENFPGVNQRNPAANYKEIMKKSDEKNQVSSTPNRKSSPALNSTGNSPAKQKNSELLDQDQNSSQDGFEFPQKVMKKKERRQKTEEKKNEEKQKIEKKKEEKKNFQTYSNNKLNKKNNNNNECVTTEAPFCYLKNPHLVNITNRLANNLGVNIDILNDDQSNSKVSDDDTY